MSMIDLTLLDYETIKYYEFVKCIEQKLYTNPFFNNHLLEIQNK